MNTKVTIVLALIFFMFGCAKEEEQQHSFDLETEKEFKIDQIYFTPDQAVEFTIDEIIDSRCPEGATCVWQGEARVHLLFEKPVVGTIDLSTYDKLKDTISNYEVQLIKVTPHPILDKQYELEDYKVKLKITQF